VNGTRADYNHQTIVCAMQYAMNACAGIHHGVHNVSADRELAY
jgi:hypothetical protein